MKFKNSLFIGILGLLNMPFAMAQGDSTETSDEPVSAVEDTTLDNSGAEAANAANSVAPEAAMPAVEQASPASEPEKAAEVVNKEVNDQAEKPNTEPEQQATSEEPAVPQTPIVEETKPAQSEPAVNQNSKLLGTYGGRIFGKYKVQLAANNLTFNDGQKCYDKLYGKPQTHGSISGDWFPLDSWVNPGLTMRMGMYSVRGKTAKGVVSNSTSIDCETLTTVENSRTTLLFIPLQVGAKVQLTPFRKKWVVLDLWLSGEYGWWQETRDTDATASIAPIGFAAADQIYTNTGRKSAISTGGSAHILLNRLDERTVRSMIDTMGLGYVYLTGFFETVKSGSKTGLSFGRNVLGVGFTFETVK